MQDVVPSGLWQEWHRNIFEIQSTNLSWLHSLLWEEDNEMFWGSSWYSSGSAQVLSLQFALDRDLNLSTGHELSQNAQPGSTLAIQ